MKKPIFKYLLVFLVSLGLLGVSAMASSEKKVEISEVAWAGTEASWADEWIELRNLTEEEIDLSGWKLTWEETTVPLGEESGNTLTVKEAVVGPGEALLLERTDDETVSTLEADVIYKGSLANSGEKLVLKDGKGNQVDLIDATEGWPAGTDSGGEPPYAAMVLKDGSWKTAKTASDQEDAGGNEIYGTPGKVAEDNE